MCETSTGCQSKNWQQWSERKKDFKQMNLSLCGHVGQRLHKALETRQFRCNDSFITSLGEGLPRMLSASLDLSRSCFVPQAQYISTKTWEHDLPSETTKALTNRKAWRCANQGAKKWASLDQQQVRQCCFWGSLCELCIKFSWGKYSSDWFGTGGRHVAWKHVE